MSPNLGEILGIPDLDIIALDVLVIQLHVFLQLIDDVFLNLF
jgi:hypothetical protein